MITIRRANDPDAILLPAIERSSADIFRQWPGLEWISFDDVQSVEQHRALIADGISIVAEIEHYGLAAFLNAEINSDALHIWQIAVHHDFQRRGIGRALITSAEKIAIDNAMEALTLTTFREVPWNEPYYQRMGFMTLARDDLNRRLKAVLDAEEQAGLPMARRCAMRRPL